MFKFRNLSLIVLLSLFGCATTNEHTGDLSEFVMGQLNRYGVDIQDEDSVPSVSATWTFKQDRYGFIIDVENADFSQMAALLTKMVGPPEVSVENNFDGQPLRLFVIKEAGVQVQCVQGNHVVQIILVGKK